MVSCKLVYDVLHCFHWLLLVVHGFCIFWYGSIHCFYIVFYMLCMVVCILKTVFCICDSACSQCFCMRVHCIRICYKFFYMLYMAVWIWLYGVVQVYIDFCMWYIVFCMFFCGCAHCLIWCSAFVAWTSSLYIVFCMCLKCCLLCLHELLCVYMELYIVYMGLGMFYIVFCNVLALLSICVNGCLHVRAWRSTVCTWMSARATRLYAFS